MKVKYSRNSSQKRKYWICDFPSLPGSPPIGRGKTKKLAFDNLLCNLFLNGYKIEDLK